VYKRQLLAIGAGLALILASIVLAPPTTG